MKVKAEFTSPCYTIETITSSITEDEAAKLIKLFDEYTDEGYSYVFDGETLFLSGLDSCDDLGEPVYEVHKLRKTHEDYVSKVTNVLED